MSDTHYETGAAPQNEVPAEAAATPDTEQVSADSIDPAVVDEPEEKGASTQPQLGEDEATPTEPKILIVEPCENASVAILDPARESSDNVEGKVLINPI